MPVTIQNTSDLSKTSAVKALVYGGSGAGKTRLCATAPRPFIFSAESGLLSLRKENVAYSTIQSFDDLKDAYEWVTSSNESKSFDTICLDSLSEIGEVCLADLKKKHKDPRKAYGELQDLVFDIVRCFRDLQEKNVYFAAKEEFVKDGLTGGVFRQPLLPGQKLAIALPYFFDEVFYLLTYTDSESGQTQRAIRTFKDSQFEGKDRSGALDPWEPANLTHIFNKIINA